MRTSAIPVLLAATFLVSALTHQAVAGGATLQKSPPCQLAAGKTYCFDITQDDPTPTLGSITVKTAGPGNVFISANGIADCRGDNPNLTLKSRLVQLPPPPIAYGAGYQEYSYDNFGEQVIFNLATSRMFPIRAAGSYTFGLSLWFTANVAGSFCHIKGGDMTAIFVSH